MSLRPKIKPVVLVIAWVGLFGSSLFAIEIKPKDKRDEVLIKEPIETGVFGGMNIKLTEINNTDAWLFGFKGGIIANHTFSIGGGIYGLAHHITVETEYPLRNYYIEFGYGGLTLELILGSRKMIHPGVNFLVGGGSICYCDRFYEPWYRDVFFVLESSAEITLNVTRCLRIDFGGSHRYINGVKLSGISDRGLSGFSGYITLKFGRF
ncbi:MAG: hypothetical protein ABIL70_00455 [candidate division WOR-3 bacterium]